MYGIPCMRSDPRAASLIVPDWLAPNDEPDLPLQLAMTIVAMAQWRKPTTYGKASSKPSIVILGLRSLRLLGSSRDQLGYAKAEGLHIIVLGYLELAI